MPKGRGIRSLVFDDLTGVQYLRTSLGNIYKQAVNDMRRAIAAYKKAELEAEIKRLEEGEV